MSNNLEPGCPAVIIESALGLHVGQHVQCIKVLGVHSTLGVIWQVRSKEKLASEYGGVGHTCDVPAKWLRIVRPGDTQQHILTAEELEHE